MIFQLEVKMKYKHLVIGILQTIAVSFPLKKVEKSFVVPFLLFNIKVTIVEFRRISA